MMAGRQDGERAFRVLYISYLHPAVAPGGAQQVAFEMFEASRAMGHTAFLIAALEAEHETEYGKPGAPVVPVPGEENQYFYFPQFYDFVHLSTGDGRGLRFLMELVERLRPDVVHFHHYHRIGVEVLRGVRLAAPKAVVCMTLHEMMAICLADGQMLKRPSRDLCRAASPVACHRCFPDLRPEFFTLRAARLRAMLDECDGFVFPSEFIADRYVEWGLPGERCAVIANGQKHLGAPADRRGHSPMVNRFGFFGQFLDNKGVDVILEAMIILAREKRVPRGGIVLEINGGNKHYASPDYLQAVAGKMAEITRLAVGPIEVRDRGAYGRDELEHRMRAVDWVVVPSTWWEVFGLVVSEAWMFGRPVIASAIGGLGERVSHGVDGLTFPVRDARALADLMSSLVGDEKRWLALNGGIRRHWSETDMLEAHLKLWAELRKEALTRSPEAAGTPSAMIAGSGPDISRGPQASGR